MQRFLLSAASLLALSLAAPANAQGELDEITVTATKREQTLQEVPVAVSVVTADTLERAQVVDVFDLQTIVPSLRVTQLQSSANTNFVIRGFGNGANNPGIEPSVGVFIDGVYRSRSAAAITDLPNLERVEVLRGPQSTLFGKNASAGVISVVTALPANELSGSLETVFGNFNQVIVRGEASIPLTDTTGIGVSFNSNQRDGYSTNLANGAEFNERDRVGFRAQLATAIGDNLALRFIGDVDKIDEQCCGVGNLVNGPTFAAIQAVGGNLLPEDVFSRDAFYNLSPFNEIDNSGFSMQADLDIGETTLTSITAWRNVNRVEDIDADFTSADILSSNFSETDIDTFTQELRLQGSTDSMDWMIGAFWFDENVTYDTDARYGDDIRLYVDILAGGPGVLAGLEGALGLPPGILFASGQGVAETTGQDNQALSIFGQVDFQLGDRATLTLGANFTSDEKDAFVSQVNTGVFSSLDFVQIGFAQIFGALEAQDPGNPANLPTAQALSVIECSPASPPPACNPLLAFQPLQILPQFVNYPNSVEDGSSSDEEVTWTVRLAFDLTDDINVYASAATGFKATSWNLSRDARPFPEDLAAIEAAGLATPNLTTGTRFAGPEEALVYEIGMKARFDQGAVNIAIFDQEIEGFQSNIFGGLGFNLSNAGKETRTGVEIDATWYPTEALQLTFAGTFLDPQYESFVGALGPNGPTDLSGQQVAGVHEQSISVSGTYMWENRLGEMFARAEYLYESDVQVVDNVPASAASREVGLLNASVGLSTEGGWDVMLWGRNLTDDEYLLSAFPSVFQAGSLSGYANEPRTYGVTLRKHFD
ncbi:MAG: TonB-dependent receptor [Woeseiaceae bacterium]|nr:TonB-dependent receptor [Woeseiaceae bacterium]